MIIVSNSPLVNAFHGEIRSLNIPPFRSLKENERNEMQNKANWVATG